MTAGPGEADPSLAQRSAAATRAPGRTPGTVHGVAAQVAAVHVAAAHAGAAQVGPQVTFDRRELGRIFGLYGRKVADGEWRDYAIDFLRDRAVFSIFRRTSEVPIYRIEKNPKLAQRQGAYSVVSASGAILRRGHELDRVLRVIDPAIYLVR